MNIRKIKLALTVGLLNSDQPNNAIGLAQELMSGFQEVGNFLGLARVQDDQLNAANVQETYAIQYENCTLNLDLVRNSQTERQYVQGFKIR